MAQKRADVTGALCRHVLKILQSCGAKNDLFWVHLEWGRGPHVKTRNQYVSQNKHSSYTLGDLSLGVWTLHHEAEAASSTSRLDSDTQQITNQPGARERAWKTSKLWTSEAGETPRQHLLWWTMIQMKLKRHIVRKVESARAREMANGVTRVLPSLKASISSLEPLWQKREPAPTSPLTNIFERTYTHAISKW